MSKNIEYVITICDRIIDWEVDHVYFSKSDFLLCDFMKGVQELKDLLERMEDDGK